VTTVSYVKLTVGGGGEGSVDNLWSIEEVGRRRGPAVGGGTTTPPRQAGRAGETACREGGQWAKEAGNGTVRRRGRRPQTDCEEEE
jgi:hypothetical protein